MGISSHGLIRVLQYLADIDSGRVVPGAPVTVVSRDRGAVVIDGASNLGIVTAWRALSIGVETVQAHAMATVVVRGCNHAGRLGSYAESAARQGLICIAGAAIPPLGHFVVPHGAAEGRLGTNPFAYGFPTQSDPIVADFATSVLPEGRIRAARLSGRQLPPEAILDAEGRPTTDPEKFYGPPRGSLLPFGGAVAYKGYALGLLVELLGGALAGFAAQDESRPINGVFFLLIDPGALLPTGRADELGQAAVDYMHSARPAPGHERVLVPGEIERDHLAGRTALDVDDAVWDQIREIGSRLGIALDDTVLEGGG
jgi:uncharacterized oxidoreductase